MPELTIGPGGEIALPDDVRGRYGFDAGTSVHLIETKAGILLVAGPQTPASDELARELVEWQSLSLKTWNLFQFEE
jgi:bifunctional DNA-binding transcriptional regulator/antitoxin component of YhaV-PrlF toxin-antitoxin module